MYSKYDQELLCRAFIRCRKSGLVNRRRVNQPFGPKKNRALPILPMSYQLSQSYYRYTATRGENTVNFQIIQITFIYHASPSSTSPDRCFSWRFPHSLCTDSFRFMRSLINNGMGDDRPVTLFYHETKNRSENEEEGSERRAASEIKRKQSERKADGKPVSEPEVQPENANDDSANKGENNQKKVEEEQRTESEEKNTEDSFTAGSGEDPSGREQTDDRLPKAAPRASEEPPDVSDMMRFSMDSPGGACVVSLSLMTLGLLNVYISIPKPIVVVDSNLVDNDVVKR